MALVLSLDVGGSPQKWISRNDAITYHAKGLVAWSYGEDSFTYTGGVSRMTGLETKITSATIVAIRGEGTHRRRMVPMLNNQALFQRDLRVCAYCGKVFSTDKLTRDHIIPVSKGGMDTWQNCVTACSTCNHKKGNKLLEKCGMKLLYVPYVPNLAEYLILKNRKIKADQMQYLLAMIPEHSRMHNREISQ